LTLWASEDVAVAADMADLEAGSQALVADIDQATRRPDDLFKLISVQSWISIERVWKILDWYGVTLSNEPGRGRRVSTGQSSQKTTVGGRS
jgi:hypothetical protein